MAYKICPNCRTANKQNAKNCINCGYYIKEMPTQYQPISNNANEKSKNKMGCLSFILAILIFISIIGCISTAVKKRQKEVRNEKTEVQTTEYKESEESATEESNNYIVPVANNFSNMRIKDVAVDDDLYVSLAYAKRSDTYDDSLGNSESIDSEHEIIYFYVEEYNNSEVVKGISEYNFDCYADSSKVSSYDSYTLAEQDGIKGKNYYVLDYISSGVALVNYVVPKDWNEIKLYYGNYCWSLSQSDVSSDPYRQGRLTTIGYEYTRYSQPGDSIFSGNYDVVYDGYDFYDGYGGKYILFEFTIDNSKSEDIIDYSSIYGMRLYHNNILVEDSIYPISETLNDYLDISSIGKIQPGMTAKVYVAFKFDGDSGDYSLTYDVGFVDSDVLGYVNIKIE